jgi:5-methyltetrahydropteroyltriglutamate--homocysteine methyltransferase
MILTNNLGYPRIGKNRELKFALESYWKKKSSLNELQKIAEEIQVNHWKLQQSAGIDLIPSNDFSFYDHVLDTAVMLGAIPQRFSELNFENDLDLYFSMARGFQPSDAENIPAMEMTKWFNTNYHYIVPEIGKSTLFNLNSHIPLTAFELGKKEGIITKPVILGPVSFLLLSKSPDEGFQPLKMLQELLPLYEQLFSRLKAAGAEWLQLDEPYLSLELSDLGLSAFGEFFEYFGKIVDRPKIILTTYFADPSINLPLLQQSPFEGIHLDLTNLEVPLELVKQLVNVKTLSLGLIDGRNVWRKDLFELFDTAFQILNNFSHDSLLISSSCSMMHVPQDVEMEKDLDPEIKSWLSFASQKLQELSVLKTALESGEPHGTLFDSNQQALASREKREMDGRLKEDPHPLLDHSQISRESSFKVRRKIQQAELSLPLLPTTTIGSFPQTSEVRKERAKFDHGEISGSDYENFLKDKIREVVKIQEQIGLDVLVHGEFERNDMVQYFGEKLDGFAFTEHGWVQSFGSRYVRPPIIHSYVRRPSPMTVDWSTFAQSLTEKPMKGMLTGPVTILQWSFVRDDQPRSETCRQIAYSIRQEVIDLETAGIRVIQIDEPALREGLPLHRGDWQEYLQWAVECFKIASTGVRDETQIHTHMCYSEFNDIIQAIAEMDADVISIEASRSKMELLEAFKHFEYPNDIGPGVYDIHSPNIPSLEDIKDLISRALVVIPAEQLWVNPDCGLKTRTWEEVIPSLKNMAAAAQEIRSELH